MKNSQFEITRVCDEIKDMLLEKNLKYGDSALDPVRVMSKADPIEQIKVRIDDKLSRLSQGHLSDDEDVINDLIGYFILLKVAQNRETTNEELSHSEYWFDTDRNRPYSGDSSEDTLSFKLDTRSSSLYNEDYSPFHHTV